MSKQKFGIAVEEDIVAEIDTIVDECTDLQASRSEVIEAILTGYLESETDHATYVRNRITDRREGKL